MPPILVVKETPRITVVKEERRFAIIAAVGRQGPRGVSGDASAVHHQTTPTDDATIVHGLNKYPAVTVKDTGDTWWLVNPEYVDLNTVRLRFPGAMTFHAYFN